MEPEYFDFFSRLPELVEKFRQAQWTPYEIFSTLFACLGAMGTVFASYLKWRNTGRRRAQRLKEYITEREKRVTNSRWELREITRRPTASVTPRPASRVFEQTELNRKVSKQGWVWLFDANRAVEKSITRRRSGASIARRALETANHELFLAHLTRGAMYDARGNHEDALDQFKNALEIKPDDLQALEYAGLQLALVGSAGRSIAHIDSVTITSNGDNDLAIGAFSVEKWAEIQAGKSVVQPGDLRFLTRMLVRSATKGDDLNSARAHRAIAFSYEKLGQPNLRSAVRHARLAANLYPHTAPVEEVAKSWEQLGCLIFNRNQTFKSAAAEALREARNKYRSILPRSRAADEVQRINNMIGYIEDAAEDTNQAPIDPGEKTILSHVLMPLKRKHNGPSSQPTGTI